MTEQAIDLDALAADLTAAGLECHIEDYSVFADTPKKRNRIQRRWRVTGFGHMFQAQFNWGEWGPNGTVLVDDWVYLDIIRSHVDPMYAKQDQPSCAPTAPAPDPVCPTCEGKNDCQVEGKYPNGEGCGYFVECPDCEGTGLDLSYEACPNCDKDLAIDVHNECIAQFKSSTVPEAEPSPLVPTPVDLHARLIEIFNANMTPYGAGNATCSDFDGVAAADAVLQLLGYPAIERPMREVSPVEEGAMPW